MSNIRNLAVSDMKTLNENDYGMPFSLTSPDGIVYNTDAVTGEQLKSVMTLSDYRKPNPETGEEIVIALPIIVVSRAALTRIPLPGERWLIRFTLEPDPDILEAEWDDFILSEVRAPEGGRSLGFIRFYPTKAVQSA